MKTISCILLLAFIVIANIFGQNGNPYSEFGYEGVVLDVQHKDFDRVTYVNTDTKSVCSKIIIDFKVRVIAFLDKNDSVLLTKSVSSDALLRWLTTDPAHQYDSPYIGMGNNPVNGVDEDGRLFGGIRSWFNAVITGGERWQNQYGDWIVAQGDNVYKNFGGSGFQGINTPDYGLNSSSFGLFNSGRIYESSVLLELDNKYYTFSEGRPPASGRCDPVYPEAFIIMSGRMALASAEANGGMTTVGRWMSKEEYAAMKNGSPAAVGAGGKTSVTIGGPNVWSAAKPGSVYVEFQVPTNCLVPGGGKGIYSILGPNASRSQLFQLQKLGGVVSPPVQNISTILKIK